MVINLIFEKFKIRKIKILFSYNSTEVNSLWIELNKMEIKYDKESEIFKVESFLLSEYSIMKSNQLNFGDRILLNIRKMVNKKYF